MLTEKQIIEIREHLEKAQNPIFFFDNDNDGLTSFLQLRRMIGRGKGIPIRSYPDLNADYFRRVKELNSDYVFILDKPVVSDEFLEQVHEDNIPLVWIDHHDVEIPKQDWINYYNPFHNDKTNEPVSYLCYKIANRKEDIWIATIGCVSDALIPDFYEEFQEKFPELAKNNPKSAFDVLFNSEIGKIDYKFSVDHNFNDLNYNEISTELGIGKVKFNLDYLEENNHVGTEHYASSGISLDFNDHNKLSFSTKKNFKTESAELYNLSYQYAIDCLTAGLVYRREFYQDSDLEPNDTLMFTITFVPFATVNTPLQSQ